VKITVKLMQWGMGMREGTVLAWLKDVGDWVDEGDSLVEIEAEKITQEMASPVSGRLIERLVEEGETVPVRSPLAVLEQ
jgi:pyruvate/2-oxoglutarate dehydrogenase complex dihydrolipoamide acyltransferase (E2) component